MEEDHLKLSKYPYDGLGLLVNINRERVYTHIIHVFETKCKNVSKLIQKSLSFHLGHDPPIYIPWIYVFFL